MASICFASLRHSFFASGSSHFGQAGYCQAYARWKEAEEFITQHGTIVKTPSGYWQQVPQVSIAQTYLKIMNKFAEQFGLTVTGKGRHIHFGQDADGFHLFC